MTSSDPAVEPPVATQRRTIFLSMGVAVPCAIALWSSVYLLSPPLTGVDTPLNALLYALHCLAAATLLSLGLGIEAIAHERLVSPSINPLAQQDSARMKVNHRFLQNTLEQLVLFAPGLLALSTHCTGPYLHAVTACTVVWIASRFVFWIGYHRSPALRAPGLIGMVQSFIILLFVCALWGYDLAGWSGAMAVPAIFFAVEGYLIWINRAGTHA